MLLFLKPIACLANRFAQSTLAGLARALPLSPRRPRGLLSRCACALITCALVASASGAHASDPLFHGTFLSVPTTFLPSGVAVADFNEDGLAGQIGNRRWCLGAVRGGR